MCKFFSFISDGKGNIYYFNYLIRELIREGVLNYQQDSHTSISTYHGFTGKKEDHMNKYEYNPLTKHLKIDQLNTINDSENIREQCLALDFKTIVPELIIKDIINPFKIQRGNTVTKAEIKLLKQWICVNNLIYDSIRYSMYGYGSIYDSVKTSIQGSVCDFVYDFVDSYVTRSICNSDSTYAYISSFFSIIKWKGIKHEKYKNPFQSGADLWELGLFPNFNEGIWRLHAGEDAKTVYETRTVYEMK